MIRPFPVFQFFNYQTRKNLIELLALINTSGAAAVFDLEDSFRIPFDEARSDALKDNARKILTEKVFGFNTNSLVTGIRVNSVRTRDYRKDLELLASIKNHHIFNYIFIPKIENALHLKEVVSDFEERGIHGVSFIPIVESKRGFENLENIAGFCRLNHIEFTAFGHCDYNRDVNAFPFIHPESDGYVELIKPFVETVERAGLKFVNSPFLELKNNELFEKVLLDTSAICKNGFAQVTLSKSQTECVKTFSVNNETFRLHEPNRRADERNKTGMADKLITEYEYFMTGKSGIAVNENGRLLSPQEYECAKEITGNAFKAKAIKEKSFNVCILGGCLPVQENIRSSDLYHNILCGYAEREFNIKPEIITERYDTFASVPQILRRTCPANRIDCLIFHVRPDPFLINVKFFAKYINDKNKKSHKFNLHILGFKEPPVMPVNRGFKKGKRNFIRTILRNANYFLGILVGNRFVMSKRYMHLVDYISDFCLQHDIEFVIVGPPARPRSRLEMLLLKNLAKKLASNTKDRLAYVNAFYEKDKDGNSLFFNDKIHYNKRGHEMFANIIFEPIRSMLNKKYQKKINFVA